MKQKKMTEKLKIYMECCRPSQRTTAKRQPTIGTWAQKSYYYGPLAHRPQPHSRHKTHVYAQAGIGPMLS